MKAIYSFALLTMLGAFLVLSSCKKPDYETAPPPGQVGTISAYLNNNFDFSLFAAAVEKVGLKDSLDNASGAFTVWAPMNSAFNNEGIFNPSDFDKWPADSLRYFVRTHILSQKLFYQNITPQTSDNRFFNLNGVALYVSKQPQAIPFIVNGVAVQAAGKLGSSQDLDFGATQLNGVIYALTGVIKNYNGTVQEFLSSRPDLSVLVAGMKKFELWDRLNGPGPYTVLAPQDSAFAHYGLTPGSLQTLKTTDYDPVLFGAYFASPYHVYVLDVLQLTYGAYLTPYKTTVDDYKMVMCALSNTINYMSAVLVKGPISDEGTAKLLGPLDPRSHLPMGSRFLNEYYASGAPIDLSHTPNNRYINFTCSNGIVHMLADVLVTPEEIKK